MSYSSAALLYTPFLIKCYWLMSHFRRMYSSWHSLTDFREHSGPKQQAVPPAALATFPLCGPNLEMFLLGTISVVFAGKARRKFEVPLTVWLGCSWPGSATHPASRPPSTDYRTSPSQHWQTCGTGGPSERRCALLGKEKRLIFFILFYGVSYWFVVWFTNTAAHAE